MTLTQVPISALQHYVYCPRKCALIHVDKVWAENEHTVRGQHGHIRTDAPGTSQEGGKVVLRAVQLYSDFFGLIGRADSIECFKDGTIIPVEYKMGTRHRDTADVQLCAQAFCLEEMLAQQISHGFIWYGTTKRRHRVEFDSALRTRTAAIIDAVRSLSDAPRLPTAVADERCNHCQLRSHCLPELSQNPDLVLAFLSEEVFECES